MQRKNSCPLCRRKVYWISIENQDYTFAKIKELQELTEYGWISTEELSENSTNSDSSASIPDSLVGFYFRNYFRFQENIYEETSSEESFILPSDYYVHSDESYRYSDESFIHL